MSGRAPAFVAEALHGQAEMSQVLQVLGRCLMSDRDGDPCRGVLGWDYSGEQQKWGWVSLCAHHYEAAPQLWPLIYTHCHERQHVDAVLAGTPIAWVVAAHAAKEAASAASAAN